MVPAVRGGSWNLKVGRNREQVKREVGLLLAAEGLDFLCVQEAAWYDAQLARIVGFDYYTTRGRSPAARDSGILVRHGLRVTGHRRLRTFTRWTRRKHPSKGLHPARHFHSVRINGLRVMSVHMPPGPHDDSRNRLAYAECMIRLMGHLRRGPFVAPGDYNKSPRASRDALTPYALAHALRARITGRGIDFVLSRGVTVTGYRHGPQHGSDHEAVLFNIEGMKR